MSLPLWRKVNSVVPPDSVASEVASEVAGADAGAATYLVGDRGVDAATAAAFASLFLIGITGGRFLAGFFADRVGDRALIRGGFVMVGVGVVMLALPLFLAVLVAPGLVMSERLGRVVDAAR